MLRVPRPVGPRQGFNLVEILITLTLVALLTTALLSFIQDFDEKARVLKARRDLARLAEQAQLAESRSGSLLSTASAQALDIPLLMEQYLVDIPDYDPWGNRFRIDSVTGSVSTSDTQGTAYVLDASFGRWISAGPDGIVQTRLGTAKADFDNDLVAEFRQKSWVAYSYTPAGDTLGHIWVSEQDGTSQQIVMPHDSFEGGATGVMNVTFSPDGSRWAGVKMNPGVQESILYGFTAPNGPGVREISVGVDVSDGTFPIFFPDGITVGWIQDDGAFWAYNHLRDQTYEMVGPAIPSPPNQVPTDTAIDYAASIGKVIHVSEERSYYHQFRSNGTDSVALAISSDGKLAFNYYGGAATQGIYLAFPNGQHRLLKETSGGVHWMPLFWIDEGNLAYFGQIGGGKIGLGRISQDGRFDIPLYDGSVGGQFPACSGISPDGKHLSYVHEPSGETAIYRTDGAGYLKAGSTPAASFVLSSANMIQASPFQEFIFPRGGGHHYYSSNDPSQGIYEVLYDLENPNLAIDTKTPALNADFPVSSVRAALDPLEIRIATVSSPTFGGSVVGVQVFPLLGPNGDYTQLSTLEPQNGNRVNVAWVEN